IIAILRRKNPSPAAPQRQAVTLLLQILKIVTLLIWVKARLLGIQVALKNIFSHSLDNLEKSIRRELNHVLDQENMLW
ncbi:hypothetical protein ABFV55_27960, partial [Pseudomonas syringae]|uniref:hypothetical protein n=1 Tax=Pseudomonas syringae TaxID=317 RepID=UPI0034D96AC9